MFLKILFMGTPDIAAACLQELIDEKRHEICAVFTREDKPVGRKKIMTAPPVKTIALENKIKVYQPKTLREENVQEEIRAINPDIIVVVAYGRILPKEVLDIPRLGVINLHVSLLPKYRGAAPIQWAVINGETQTGVTIMQLNEGLDTGDIIECTSVEIDGNETAGELLLKVTSIGSERLCRTLENIESGKYSLTPQDNSKMSLAPPLEKHMAEIEFAKSACTVHNLVRGMNPWPLSYFVLGDKKVKVVKTSVDGDVNTRREYAPKTVIKIKPFTVACGEHAIILHEIVPEGKKPMSGEQWALGRRLSSGDILDKI